MKILSCGTHWKAVCLCGWTSTPHTYRRDCHEAAVEHRHSCPARERVAS